jgi:hypothetical protein
MMMPGSSSITMRTTKGSTVTLVFRMPWRTGGTEQQLNVSGAMSQVPGHCWPGAAIPPPCRAQVRDSNTLGSVEAVVVVALGEMVP